MVEQYTINPIYLVGRIIGRIYMNNKIQSLKGQIDYMREIHCNKLADLLADELTIELEKYLNVGEEKKKEELERRR